MWTRAASCVACAANGTAATGVAAAAFVSTTGFSEPCCCTLAVFGFAALGFSTFGFVGFSAAGAAAPRPPIHHHKPPATITKATFPSELRRQLRDARSAEEQQDWEELERLKEQLRKLMERM